MGPLKGIRVVEFAGLGPGPFAAMWLADMGADVVRIDRHDGRDPFPMEYDVLARGRRSVTANLKSDEGRELALKLMDAADLVIEGFRPGVMERLGLGPEEACARNPRLIYGRMTGWGQDGPLAQVAGHDINYIALTGALHAIGEEKPQPPLNLVGDFGGGAMYLVAGLLAALVERGVSGRGQVVDAAIVDGTAHLMAMIYGMQANKMWQDQRNANPLDGAAHYYRCYACADGAWLAVGAIEPQFYALLQQLTQAEGIDGQSNPDDWAAKGGILEQLFLTRPRAEWLQVLEGTDACVAPVLSMQDAPQHPHMAARGVFAQRDGVTQPTPAPHLSRTPGALDRPPPVKGADLNDVLTDWEIS
ncbi:alpha-methylacyl-CoA racemase [Monaibacterium marinum]|uniref:Alpha-methylacyl-CoA racemase n=1 Tax=Pontivivens marinum TaxID=1690039 RepID=A0A2C9CV27_9RHOB|nr:CaiB/BaiF CoA-transferase family protein [Monaibacterium marinum]SOH95351.1 alpha-methylacyl-CoA racemase [Monaibacterium marinum]